MLRLNNIGATRKMFTWPGLANQNSRFNFPYPMTVADNQTLFLNLKLRKHHLVIQQSHHFPRKKNSLIYKLVIIFDGKHCSDCVSSMANFPRNLRKVLNEQNSKI